MCLCMGIYFDLVSGPGFDSSAYNTDHVDYLID